MHLINVLKTILIDLKVNKIRSFLTILGIVIGIAAVVLIVSIGQGSQNLILGQLKTIGPEVVTISPGKEPKTGIGAGLIGLIFSNSLKSKDLHLLREKDNVPEAEDVFPIVLVPTPKGISYQRKIYHQAMVTGWTASYISKIFNIYPAKGYFFTDRDTKELASVAVIGSKIKEELFGSSDVLGKKIKIKDRKFKIVGILPKKGQVSMFDFDSMVVIPYTTAQKYLLGTNYYTKIIAKAKNEALVPQMIANIKATIRQSHNITNPKNDDFFIVTQTDIADRLKVITQILIILLVSVAAISLVVGSIGIMNIMLVSVTERTYEIGLRKAVGARNKDILQQFLLETIILTIVGGIIGIILGILFSYIAGLIIGKIVNINWQFTISWWSIILAFTVSAIIGLISGFYPARRAANLNPIEALRYE